MKNINLLTISLVILILFVVYLFFYMMQINKNEKQYRKFYDNIFKLEILNKEFNAFLLSQRKVVNFDKIVSKTKNFERIVQKLLKSNIDREYGSNINTSLLEIQKLYTKKEALIERFKSYNATSVYTLVHLFELLDKIKKDNVFNKEGLYNINEVLDNSLFDLMKIYLNFQINTKNLYLNISKLTPFIDKSTKIFYFYINIRSAFNKLKKLSKIKANVHKILLGKAIYLLQNNIDKKHDNIVNKQEIIMTYMLIFTFILLLVLLFIYIKSIKFQKELSAFKYAVQNSDDTILMTDQNRHITYINDAFSQNTGYSKDEALGKNPSILKSGKLPQDFYNNLNTILDRGEKWTGEFINKNKKGEIYYEKASITPMFINKKLIGYLGIKLNITNYIKEQKKVEWLAYHDSLTMLPNRRQMKKVIIRELSNHKNRYIALFFLDLDGFKNINDTLGHDVGDILLIKLSKKLKKYMGKDDRVFRTGGDEFAMLLCSKEKDESEFVAKKILQLANEPIFAFNHTLRVGISIGIARFDKENDNLISLLKHADLAMYEAKQNGKNKYHYYTKILSAKINKRMAVEQKLSSALQNGDFFVVYQPKYDIKSQKIISLESLIRWEDKELGFIPPDYFVPIAEEMNVINKIGEFVFRKSCEDFLYFKEKYHDLQSISINVSPAQFMDFDLVSKFKKIIKEIGIEAKNIGIEITETHLMQNIQDNIKLLNQFKEIGCKIIIDDFGTGYSSLNYLKKLPIDILKIDKSFIDDICTDENDIEIVKAIMGISKSFQYITIAEGIETKEQEETLFGMGLEIGQGFLFCKPKSRSQIIEFF